MLLRCCAAGGRDRKIASAGGSGQEEARCKRNGPVQSAKGPTGCSCAANVLLTCC